MAKKNYKKLIKLKNYQQTHYLWSAKIMLIYESVLRNLCFEIQL